MIKLVYVIDKRADLDDAAFRDYWLDRHGPRVKSHAKAIRVEKLARHGR